MDFEIFQKQIAYKPEIKGGEILAYDNVIVAGMGGSSHPARIFCFLDPTFPLWLHNDAGFPEKTEGRTLFVAISYSGNTAETIDFAQAVLAKNLPLAVITSGGALLELAEKNKLPHVVVPGDMQPRDSILYMLKALLALLGKTSLLAEIEGVDLAKIPAKDMHGELGENIALVYSSRENHVLGYLWKILLNETGKLPAFHNVFPELTHNEMQGVLAEQNGKFLAQMHAILLKDREDNDIVRREMQAFVEEAEENGLAYTALELPASRVNKFFATWLSARASARALAAGRKVNPDEVPIVASFKKRLKG